MSSNEASLASEQNTKAVDMDTGVVSDIPMSDKESIAELQRRNKRLQDALDSANQLNQSRFDALRKVEQDNLRLDVDLAEAVSRVEELDNELFPLRTQVADMAKECRKLKDEGNVMEEQLTEGRLVNQELKHDLTHRESMLMDAEAEVKRLRIQLKTAQATVIAQSAFISTYRPD